MQLTTDLHQIQRGLITVEPKVEGYWGHVISGTIERDYRTGKWEASLRHSSGGRDGKEVENDLDAERNFALAILATIDHMREVLDQQKTLEMIYQQHKQATKEKA